MSHGLLEVLRYFLLAMLWLFFVYAARMVYVDVRRSRAARTPEPQSTNNRPPRSSSSLLHVRILEPPEQRGRTYEIADDITLGRSSSCVIVLDGDKFASSMHARIFQGSGDVWVEDLGSTNGTYLNSERLTAPTKLHRGDRVKVGGTLLEVRR